MKRRKLDDMQESAWGKTHADYLWNVIEWQGECLVWKVRRKHYIPDGINKRGNVKDFSRASRLRLMRVFARLDWEENMPYLFMTLTYPDTTLLKDRWVELSREQRYDEERYKDVEYLRITAHRWVFWRYLENYLGEKCAGIWRIEWKPRLSGPLERRPMPHLHILLCKTRYVPWQEVRWAWMNTIGERFVNVDVRGCYDREIVVTYLSKYLGKVEDGTLEDDAYLDSIPPGRAWGVMRKNLLVQEEKFMGRYFETDDLASLRHYACPEKVELIDAGMCSFTLIGPKAREVGEILVGMPEDKRVASDIDGNALPW
jgi:hypothetical protein